MPKYKIPHFGASGRPETMNETALVRSGEIGVVYEEGTKRWQIVKIVDAANAAIGDVLYWKNRATFTVTPTIANSSQNEVAGIAEVIAGGANYFIAVRQGGVMSVKSADATINARGLQVTSDAANNRVILAAGVIAKIGVAQAAQAAGFVSVDLNIPSA